MLVPYPTLHGACGYGLEECLRHLESMDSTELQDKAKEMIDDCSKDELKKILNLLIKIARKSFEND